MEIRKYLRLILRWWWLVAVSTAVPMMLSYYFTSTQADVYQAKATVMVGTSLQNPNPDPWQLNLGNTMTAAYAELVRQNPVTEAVIERLGLDRTPAQLAGQITPRIYSGAQLLEMQVTDTNPEAAALIANALADELIRRSPASRGSDPEQQEFVRNQLEELQAKIGSVSQQIDELTASLSNLTSASEIQEAQDRIAALEEVKSTYQTTYTNLLGSYRAESPNVLSLFDPAVVPQWPVPSKTKLIVVMAGAAGIGLALGAIFLMEYLDTSLRWERDGMQSILELPVLGAIPRVSRRGTWRSDSLLSPVAESMRTMRASIFLARPDHSFGTLLVTSPGDSEGKSFVVANLAIVLSSTGSRVIVVDADMRRPTLHEFFDRPNVTGLADVLSDSKVAGGDFSSLPLQETGFDNLHLISAGRPPVDPATLLTSPRFQALLTFLGGHGDVILVDSPPVLSAPDAIILSTESEGTILVVSIGLTRRESLWQARDRLLAQQGVHLLGLAVNRVKPGGRHNCYGRTRESEKLDGQRAGVAERWLTLGEAADRLGVGEDVVRRWCKSGRLPAIKKGLRWQVDRDGLERMVESGWKVQMQTGP